MAYLGSRRLNGRRQLVTLGVSVSIDQGGAGGGTTTPVVVSPAGDWDALTPYSQVAISWKNAAAVPLVTPFVMTNHRLQRGDVPAGSHLGLFKGDGTAILTQQDNEALPWADGSMSSATIAAILPDTLAATGGAGDTGSYFVKAVPGAPPRTPKFSLAAWAAQNDLKLRICTNLANLNDATAQLEFRVSDAVSAGLYEGSSTGSDYPLTSIHVDRSGPVCMGWKFKGFARRVSDGAWHRTLTGELYVTATSLTDMLIDGMLKMPMGYTTGKNPAQTIGATSNDDNNPIHGVVQLWNGSTLLHTWGGPGDYRSTTVALDVPSNRFKFPKTGVGRSRQAMPIVFTSTGALPGGVKPNRVYFPRQDYDTYICTMWTRRAFVATLYGTASYQASHPYPIWDQYGAVSTVSGDVNLIQTYACSQPGTSGASSPPTGDADDQVDGTCKWIPGNIVLKDAGSGTLSAYPVIGIYPTCGAAFVDELTTDPIWTGTGPAPRVEAIKDLTYLCRYARALPPYDLTLSPLYETGLPFDGYSVSEPYVQSAIDYFGDDPGTNLIGYLNVSGANALLNQTSVQVQRHQRAEALGWSDHWLYVEDARSLQPIVGTAGPGNAAGKYAGLGPSLPGFWYDYRGGDVAPGYFLGLGNSLAGNFYTARYGTMLDGSHLPAFWILAWEKTARTIFLDQGIALANGTILGCYKNDNVLKGRTYYNTSLVVQQQRGSGWATRALDTLDDVLPAAHPTRAYFTDLVQDGLDHATAVIEDNRVNRPINYAMGTLRWSDNGPNIQMWFAAFMLTSMAQAARKNRRPEWRTIVEHICTRFYLKFYDDDNGGNSGLIDWNLFAGCRPFHVNQGAVAGDTFTVSCDNDSVGISYSNTYTKPSPSTYTATASMTPAQTATALCNFINGNPAYQAFGWLAVDDDVDGYFRVNLTSGLFSTTNNHAEVSLQIASQKVIRPSFQQVVLLGRINEYGDQLRSKFSTLEETMAYNLGPNWPQTAQGKVSLAGTGPALKGAAGYIPWDTTDYPNIHWACMATLTEAGITRARIIYDRVTARIQATGGGPTFSFVPYARFSPDQSGRTYNNFNLVAYHLQATRTQH